MIPFIKIYTRRFHVTSQLYLRKVGPKTSLNDPKPDLPESKLDLPPSSHTSPDYLGIESDDNVITVGAQKYQLEKSQISDTKEKFYRTSFGIVRLDNDNKLKYHGQYKRKRDFTFPHSSTEHVKVSNISEIHSFKNRIAQDLPLKDSQNQTVTPVDMLNVKIREDLPCDEKDLDDINYFDNYYFGGYETKNVSQTEKQQTAREELNFFEKDFEAVYSRSPTFDQNTSKYRDCKQQFEAPFSSENQTEELNYLEKNFFEPVNISENIQKEQNTAEHIKSEKNCSNLDSTDQSKEFNYIENTYIESLTNSENHLVKQNILNSAKNEKKLNSELDTGDLIIENNNLNTAVDDFSFNDKSLYENNQLSNNQNFTDYEDVLKSNPIDERNYYAETHKHEQTLGLGLNSNSSALKKQTQTTQNSDITSYEKINSSVKNSHISKAKELLTKTTGSFLNKNDSKLSKLDSMEPDQDNKISTAHDFVTKLRKDQKIPSQIPNKSKGDSIFEEKFDSKGFRILKNQVPNLSYFTHDEIFNILKQNIVYSDENLLVLNKPYSLVIHESKTTKEPCLSSFLDKLAKELDKQSRNPKLFTVHRLDKETTGCLLLARNETMAMHLKALLSQRKIVKKYWIVTVGVPDPPEGVIDIPISEGSIDDKKRMVLYPKLSSDIPYRNHSKDGKPAVTTYKVISESGNAALVEVFPKTGIKHQIRVHFGFGLGCPILGDHKYSHLDKFVPQKLPSDMLQRLSVRQSKVRYIPMHIHAKSVGIPDYFDKRDLFVNIPIPDHFKINLKRLKFKKKNMIY